MNFLRTKSGELIAIVEIFKLFQVERPDGSHCVCAHMRGASGVIVELARDYSIEQLARALDPIRASR